MVQIAVRSKRADAQRNIEAILDAAAVCLSGNPEASIAEIAQTAGVGRVTLYAGRLAADAAAFTIAATVLTAFTPPGEPVPWVDERMLS